MYQLLLTRRYLTSKVMPLLAAVAVTLCTAMVLIVWSVMGGFLNMLLTSGKAMTGDVVISWPNAGIPHYEDLIEDLEASDMVVAAAPMIETFGMLSLPNDRLLGVNVRGVEGPSFARVANYEPAIWWRSIDEPTPKDTDREDYRLDNQAFFDRLYTDGVYLTDRAVVAEDGTLIGGEPAVALGIEVSGFNIRTEAGIYIPGMVPRQQFSGEQVLVDDFLPISNVTLSVLPVDQIGRKLEMVTRLMPVANEFQSGLYEVDNSTVLIRFDELQRMLNLDPAERVVEGSGFNPFDPDAVPQRVTEPGRATHILVRLEDGADADVLKEQLRDVYRSFAVGHADSVAPPPKSDQVRVQSWRDLNRTLISAVEKETGLVLFIFSFISLTSVFLVLSIFWSMVSEKTKDVGVLRSIGASQTGIAGIWLGYGMALGLLGSVAGVALAYAIVTNINNIHDWLGATFGLVIWDPSVYYFVEIPHTVEPDKAVFVFVGGLVCSVLGALIPAVRAARMDPVRALRFE